MKYLKDHDDFQPILTQIHEVYDTMEDRKKIRIVKKSLNRIELVFKIFFVLYFCCIFLFMLSPFITYFFDGKSTMILEILIPYVDPQSVVGYTLTTAIHLVFLLYGLLGFLGFDLSLFVSAYHVVIMSDTLVCDLQELTEFLAENDLKIPKNKKKADEKLKQIYKNHEKVLR